MIAVVVEYGGRSGNAERNQFRTAWPLVPDVHNLRADIFLRQRACFLVTSAWRVGSVLYHGGAPSVCPLACLERIFLVWEACIICLHVVFVSTCRCIISRSTRLLTAFFTVPCTGRSARPYITWIHLVCTPRNITYSHPETTRYVCSVAKLWGTCIVESFVGLVL